MKYVPLAFLSLTVSSPVIAGTITINAFNNSTVATVSYDNGGGQSGTISTLLTQYNVTLTGAGTPQTFNTFSIDLFHTVTVGQTYAVNPRTDEAAAFANGGRMSYIFTTFGLQDLTSNAIQAAAVQISLWDLSLNNHAPTSFAADGGGTYSSGDPGVFSVNFGANPNASQIAVLTNQYLQLSIGATNQGNWLDASPSGNTPNPGQSLAAPVPEPSSAMLLLTGILAGAARLRVRPRH